MTKRQRVEWVEFSNSHAASETLGTPVEKSASDDVRPFDLILDVMNGF
jgi:hypothetical protein